MKKSIILVDGEWYRHEYKCATGSNPTAEDVARIAAAGAATDNHLFLRAVFYDGWPSEDVVESRTDLEKREELAARRRLLEEIGELPKFELRTGRLVAKGNGRLAQKGVDLLIGLDAAYYSMSRIVERIIFVAGDTDLVPAMDFARRQGVHVWAVLPPGKPLHREILRAVDFAARFAVIWRRP